MKRIVLLLAFASLAFAQRGTYTVSQKTALTGTAEVVTVQLAAAVVPTVTFTAASIYCSVECEFTVERNGTAATSTAITPVASRSTDQTVTATAYRASNAGAGSVMARHVVPAGVTMTLDMTSVRLLAGQNLTIRTAAITGTALINIQWTEYSAE